MSTRTAATKVPGIALALAAASVLASGCGGMSEEEKRDQARQERAQKQRAEERRERARQQTAYDACAGTFEDLQEAVDELDSRLNVGLNYENYSTEVADIRVVYDRTDFDALDDVECIGDVGLPLERALNQYVKAANIWDECFEDIYCEMDSVQPDMQAHWSKASKAADNASRGLEAMHP